MNPIGYVLAQWLHVMAAITLLGGTIFLRLAVIPAEKHLEGDAKEGFDRALRRKIVMLTHSSFLFLIITGLINYGRRAAEGATVLWSIIVGIKILLAFAVIGIAVMLTIPSDALKTFQQRRPHWLAINIVLGLAVVLLSAWLRLMPNK
ncbi:hypothetical protein HYR69_04380 [Candidatus Sumerlaeota bacterium]|nr:hypothetical protein [Candidatus Sumerlaeota bacterium]MBI3735529.1 hypothetical protein [Candidatus Sumerlaeota bacterium]